MVMATAKRCEHVLTPLFVIHEWIPSKTQNVCIQNTCEHNVCSIFANVFNHPCDLVIEVSSTHQSEQPLVLRVFRFLNILKCKLVSINIDLKHACLRRYRSASANVAILLHLTSWQRAEWDPFVSDLKGCAICWTKSCASWDVYRMLQNCNCIGIFAIDCHSNCEFFHVRCIIAYEKIPEMSEVLAKVHQRMLHSVSQRNMQTTDCIRLYVNTTENDFFVDIFKETSL